MNTSLRLSVSDSSQAGEARRLATTWARQQGCSDEFIAKMALVVTELATNLALHTRGGVLLLRNLSVPGNCGVELLSLDSGPGVANFSECLRDGHSTAGTAGIGLGAVRRASETFEVHSQPGLGTALLSVLWAKPPEREPAPFRGGAASVPLAGQEVCGDTWAVRPIGPDRVRLLVADGLGHGQFAADASRKAVEVFSHGDRQPLLPLLDTMHQAMKTTRGAAVAIAEIDLAAQRLVYAGVGNIASEILHHEKTTSLVSLNGTVGAQFRKAQEFIYPWSKGASLMMHSDGIKTQWSMERHSGLAARHPALIAGVLYRDFARANDDATIVVWGAVA
jgi:anti-sigma regulatory factor (Ser/Thr protein kinase)